MDISETIVAVATGVGGAISVIRVGGEHAIELCDNVFESASGKKLTSQRGYTLHYGSIVDHGCQPIAIIDDVVVSIYRAPQSYTGENMVEISCHGSTYIQQEITKLLIRAGARSAQAGEFTIRAFLNGKLDLAQAEAVADMIASTDKATHALALQQIKGGYSSEFQSLRDRLIELMSLLELELDFAEEDVEFADRTELLKVIEDIETKVNRLLDSFNLGNSLKNGIPVAIVGEPNVGKSTLLNTLLNEDRAMVSEIAGTTRDVIEESLNIDGVRFRFIDTAGIRETTDRLEQMGIERTMSSIDRARIVIALVDAPSLLDLQYADVKQYAIDALQQRISNLELRDDQKLCIVLNKSDKLAQPVADILRDRVGGSIVAEVIVISAKTGRGVQNLISFLSQGVCVEPLYHGDTVVSNTRHYEALRNAKLSLNQAHDAMQDGLPTDLLSQEIKLTIHYLGLITGEITTNDILGSIFSKFCIGK